MPPGTREQVDHTRVLITRFNKVRNEGRAGKGVFHRRYKSASLNLLEHLLYLVNLLGNLTYPNTSRSVRRRAHQIQTQIDNCRANKLPPRDRPLLPHLEEGSESEDSVLAETVVCSSSSEEELEVLTNTGVWAPRFSGVRITANNPLLRRSGAASGSSSSLTPAPPLDPPPSPFELPYGVGISPELTQKIDCKYLLSIDWHQVLDTVRCQGQTLRPRGYYLLDEIKTRLRELKARVNGLVIVINSYCHCTEFRTSVLKVPDREVDYRIVTSYRAGVGGKLGALRSITKEGCGIAHVDDSAEVIAEFKYKSKEKGSSLKIFGITIPRAGRRRPQERVDGIQYYRNILEVLDALIEGI